MTTWNDVAFEAASGISAHRTVYETDDGRSREATSRTRFATKDATATRLAEAGPAVDRWLGDWSGGSWSSHAPEIIPTGWLA